MRRETFLPFAPPSIGPEEVEEVLHTLNSGRLTTGPKVARFEREFADFVGARAAVAVSSCTAGLMATLQVSGIGAGDAVLTTALTFPGTVNAVEHAGATPVLVDVSPDTLNLAPDLVARELDRLESIDLRPRAILPVHYAGHPCDLVPLRRLAAERDLLLLEDAAHALPARVGDELVGGDVVGTGHDSLSVASFSFYANKNITTAEGGMLTGPPDLMERARIHTRHGLIRGGGAPWDYDVLAPGLKLNMTDLAASIGLRQLEKLPAFHARRREIAAMYTEAFSGTEELETPTERAGFGHAWHLYPLRLHLDTLTIDRDRFLKEMERRNIGVSVHFVPVHLHTFYRETYGYRPESFPVALREFRRLVSLPIYPRMSDGDVGDVIRAVTEIVESSGR